MKFAHMADCHLGSWSNHPDLKEYPSIAFERAMEGCINEKVDFIIIAGDLFDTSMPSIDVLKRAAAAMRKCREAGIPIYVIPGSHDYSPTGKTMMAVLEEAGLLTDISKHSEENGKINLTITKDKKTGICLTGVMGKKGGLDAKLYENIEKPLLTELFNIFVFHAAVAEYRPENMKDVLAVSLNDLPKGFQYYATGHVHQQFFDRENKIVFPGELFPTSFDELEKYNGGYVLVEEKNGKLDVNWKYVNLFEVVLLKFDVTGKTTASIENEIINKLDSKSLQNAVVLLKLNGVIEAGKISDINFNEITKRAIEKGASVVKRSTSGVTVKEFEEANITESMSSDQIERGLIEQYVERLRFSGVVDVEDFVIELMSALNQEKQEDETTASFEERIKSSAKKVVGL
jgi:DNA repair protein SbcD/Mre11